MDTRIVSPEKALDMVNAALAMFDEAPLDVFLSGTRSQQIESIIKEYARRLRIKVPKYKVIVDDRMLPETIIQYLYKALDDRE